MIVAIEKSIRTVPIEAAMASAGREKKDAHTFQEILKRKRKKIIDNEISDSGEPIGSLIEQERNDS